MKKKEKVVEEIWEWDDWQKEVLEHEGHITLRTGRQVGKSEVVGAKAVRFALKYGGTTTLVIAASQRQATLLFEKVKGNLDRLEEGGEKVYGEPPTLTKIVLLNGSKIYALPAGRTGYFIRGFTIDLLIADEAAYIPETVWTAVTPMIAVSRKKRGLGWMILLSTPFGCDGYYFESFKDPDFRKFHISSEDCSRIPRDFLAKEKKRMTRQEYRQEYLGEFTVDISSFFSAELLKERAVLEGWDYGKDYSRFGKYYLGVDFARYGGDENAYVVVEMVGDRLRVVWCDATDRVSCTETVRRIVDLDRKFGFRKVFVDDGGLGAPMLDFLQKELGRKVLGLNNASKSVEVQGLEKRHRILKEDLYNNCLLLLEDGCLDLLNDCDLLRSMKSITFEYGSEKGGSGRHVYIYGRYSHLSEALVRACWCVKERGLRLFRY